MEFSGSRFIAATPQEVWSHMYNPDTMKTCIIGCELFDGTPETGFDVVVAKRVSLLKMRFRGTIEIIDPIPAQSCILIGEGQGGIAGLATGQASMSLTPREGGTEMAYIVSTTLGGKIAHIGNKVVGAVASGMIDRFFDRFETCIIASRPSAETPDPR